MDDLQVEEIARGEDFPFKYDSHCIPSGGNVTMVVAKRKPGQPGQDPEQRYAQKTIRLSTSEDSAAKRAQVLDLFRREARNLHRARHQHCIRVHRAFECVDQDHPFLTIIMDRADRDLWAYLKNTRHSGDKTRQISGWIGCLVGAVAHIHSIGIRHRDIKPTNILIKGGAILLADFGISKMGLGNTLSTTEPEKRAQTHRYAAPEVVDGSTRGRAADVFSLGAVMYEMLRTHDNELDEVVKLITHDSSMPSSYSRELENVHAQMAELKKTMEEEEEKDDDDDEASRWKIKVLDLCGRMMSENRDERPWADEVYDAVSALPRDGGSPGACTCAADEPTDAQRLVDACKKSDDDDGAVRLILAKSAGALRSTVGGIHQASARGHRKQVQAFLDHGTDVNLRNYGEQTALHHAAGYGHDALVETLLGRAGIETSPEDEDGQTPLHCASGHGHLSIVERLVRTDAGGAITRTDHYGQTPLHCATKRGHTAVVAFLVGQKPQAATLRDLKGRSALHFAAGNGSLEAVETLFGCLAGMGGSHATDQVEAADRDGWTAFHFAVKRGHAPTARYLLDRMDMENAARRERNCQLALRVAAERGLDDIVGMVLQALGKHSPDAAGLESQVNAKDETGQTALHLTVSGRRRGGRYWQVVRLLLKAGADVAARDSSGSTPLDYATRRREEGDHGSEIARLLEEWPCGEPETTTSREQSLRMVSTRSTFEASHVGELSCLTAQTSVQDNQPDGPVAGPPSHSAHQGGQKREGIGGARDRKRWWACFCCFRG